MSDTKIYVNGKSVSKKMLEELRGNYSIKLVEVSSNNFIIKERLYG